MTDALCGLDPELTTFGRITKRTTPDPDVRFGLGSPRQFPFNNGPTLDPVWWAEAPPPGWSVNQINGVLQINAVNSNSASDQTQRIAINAAFDLANMVSIAFRIRVTQVKNAYDLRVELAAGIVLRVTNLGRTSSWANALNIDAVLAASLINKSSGWVDVVMLLTAGGVTLWESSGISFSLSEYPGNAAAKRN